MFAELDSVEVAVQLKAGDWLVITSDGIPEATGENGEDFGDMRLLGMLDPARTTDNFCCAALDAVISFAGNKQADDLTIIAARVLPANGRK
jgi:serine phosphatase RsbU (regulator of sigma subunit)